LDLWHEILDSINDAVIVLSPALDPIAFNAAAEAALEASKVDRSKVGRLIRRNPWLRRMVDQCLHNGQSFDNPEATLILDQRSLVVRAEVSPLISPAGYFEGASIMFHDLSHQKSAEQAFEADENTFRLSPAGLAHEVKNPLTGIKGAAELLSGMFPGDTRARLYCELILDGVNRIAGLVEQVLAATNPQRLKREPFNIHQVLHQALRMAGLMLGDTDDVLIEQDFDPSLPAVDGDAAALERVFLNLLRNAHEAIDAAHGDGPSMGRPSASPKSPRDSSAFEVPKVAGTRPRGTIRLRTAMENQFRVSAHGKRRRFLRVEVSDTGRGMSDAELQQIFTPFFTTKPSGTGLGLVLSQRIVALHGGKLWAERGAMLPRGVTRPARPSTRRHSEDAPGDLQIHPLGDTILHPSVDRTLDSSSAGATPPPGDGAGNPSEPEELQPRGMTFCVMLPVGPH
jgi:two-component system, NtrC family, nitrogen regulation sensor histidine kinase GlnL